MFDFPTAPIAGAEYTSAGVTYVYTGTVWDIKSGASSDYVLKTGDTITGKLWLENSRLVLTGVSGGSSGTTQSITFSRINDDLKPFGEIKANWTGFVSNGLEATMEFWVGVGGYGYQKAFNTTVASPPGINVNGQSQGNTLYSRGDCSAMTFTDRTLLADPELQQFITGEGEERGVDIGVVIKHLLCEIAELREKLHHV